MAPHFDSPPRSLPDPFSQPQPRPPRTPAEAARVRVRNRRRDYLDKNPAYLESAEHEFADPLLFDSLVRRFHTPAEREAEGRAKGYSRTLETSLLRGEARLARTVRLAEEQSSGNAAGEAGQDQQRSTSDEDPGPDSAEPAVDPHGAGAVVEPAAEAEERRQPAQTREEGRARWEEFLRARFVRGEDDEFEYRLVDEDDAFDALERRDQEEAWFDDEDPDWASVEGGRRSGSGSGGTSGGGSSVHVDKILSGETGIQDF